MVGIEAAETLRASDPDAVIFDPTTVITAGQGYLASKKGIRSKDGKATIKGYLRAVRKACDFVIADKSLDKTVESIKGKYDFRRSRARGGKGRTPRCRSAWLAAGQENLLRTSRAAGTRSTATWSRRTWSRAARTRASGSPTTWCHRPEEGEAAMTMTEQRESPAPAAGATPPAATCS